MESNQQDETIRDRIIGLLRKGYNRRQLLNDFGFAERTVDAAIKAYKELTGENAHGAKEEADASIKDEESKSTGKQATGSKGRDGALAIRREKESVLPEWLEADVAEIFNGQARDQRIFLAGMSVPLMGLRLFAEGVKPIIDLLTAWQEGQARAAREAERTGIEMAQAAGEAAATGVGKFFMDTKPWLAAAPDPFQAMMADTMRPILQQVMGQVIASVMRITSRGQVGLQPSAGTGVPPQGGSQSSQHRQPGGIQEASNEEIKEAFND